MRRVIRGPQGAYVTLVLVITFGAYMQQRHNDHVARDAIIAGCERGKLDRIDHARVYRAQATYWEGVLRAQSVKEDVKRIARRVHSAVVASERGMESRILKCEPLVYGKRVIDRDALRSIGNPAN